MPKRKNASRKAKIIGASLFIIGVLLCFAGYKNSTIALAGVACCGLGAVIATDPIHYLFN